MGYELKFSYQETLTQDMFLPSTRKSMGKKYMLTSPGEGLYYDYSAIFSTTYSKKRD